MKFEYVPDSEPGYYSSQVGGMEICIEPCMFGFCVGIYKGKWLLIPKEQIHSEDYNGADPVHVISAFNKAVKVAQTMPDKVREAAKTRDELRGF